MTRTGPNAIYYLTTPIYYVNSKPHIGHAYTTFAADILARNAKLLGRETHFLTGTDENSLKNVEAAKKAGKPVAEFIDELSTTWSQTWRKLGIQHSGFIRTTQDIHKQAVIKFWDAVKESGDLYEGTYEGLYCAPCEAFVTESDLNEDGKCPLHLRRPDQVKEGNFFFKASKYKRKILAHIKENPDFIQPIARRNEVIAYIEEHFQDISVSRYALEWGIPVPDEPDQVIYVWFDALINYLSGAGYGWDEKAFKNLWPANLHIVGKDIIKFHCALWPAMLLSAGLPLPKKIFAHGFFTVDGQKISKSLGNAIDPLHIAEKYGNDVLRYYLFSRIPFGSDGDFCFKQLEEAYTADLANTLGNLASRVAGMSAKYFDNGIVSLGTANAVNTFPALQKWLKEVQEQTARLEFKEALEAIMDRARMLNRRIEQQKPWQLAKEDRLDDLERFLSGLALQLVYIGQAILPYMPSTGKKLVQHFSADFVTKITPLFPKEKA